MDDIAKYKLELISIDDTYKRCRVSGLKKAYYKCSYKNDELEDFGGACGLIRNSEYKGYCNLCSVYHSNKTDNLPEPGYTVEFSPLYNEYGQMILIEYDQDVLYCSIDRGGYKENWDSDKIVDARITFWVNGTFTEFKNEY